MKKFIKSLWEISVVPLALVIPWVSLALLPFQPMHNFLIGVVLGVLMIFYTYSARGERISDKLADFCFCPQSCR